MNIFKIILISLFLSFSGTNSFSVENNTDCENIKNIGKKIVCKVKVTTKKISSKVSTKHEEINSKKTLVDWFKKKEK